MPCASEDQELAEARAQLRALSEMAVSDAPPIAGVLIEAGASPLDEIRALVVAGELGRRLDGWAIRTYQAGRIDARPAADGSPIWPLAADPAARHQVPETLDVLVATGTWRPPAGETVATLLTEVAGQGCAVHLAGAVIVESVPPGAARPARWPNGLNTLRPPSSVVGWAPPEEPQARRKTVADPLVLADRVFDPVLLNQQTEYVRFTGSIPPGPGNVLVYLSDRQFHLCGPLAQALNGDGRGVAVVGGQRGGAGEWLADLAARIDRAVLVPAPATPWDLAAATAASDLVISDNAGILWLAQALRRPFLGLDATPGGQLRALSAWLDDPTVITADPASVTSQRTGAERRADDATCGRGAIDELELFFDDLAGAVATMPARRLATAVHARLAQANFRIGVLEATNIGLRHSLRKHRLAFGELAHRANVGEPDRGVSVMEHRALQNRLARSDEDLGAAQAELARIYATRTMRTLAPARRMYGRVRNLL